MRFILICYFFIICSYAIVTKRTENKRRDDNNNNNKLTRRGFCIFAPTLFDVEYEAFYFSLHHVRIHVDKKWKMGVQMSGERHVSFINGNQKKNTV